MTLIGQLALALALVLALYSIGANIYGLRKRRGDVLASARHALWAMTAMVALAAFALWNGLIRSDFSLEYVASYSSTTLPTIYKITALWGGQQGSLLLWTLLLSLFTAVVAIQTRERNSEIAPYVLIVMAVVAVFFLGMLNLVTRPFDPMIPAPAQGTDLNPLLQNYWMAIHPPSLYTGYVSTTVPFAFACAALLSGRLDDGWIRSTRRWALFSWFFLTLGNMFGARWAYEVLGWGGYWAWDPVENAAFMPWLVMTAYLHSVMVQERKDMLKVWNLALIGLAFALTLFGTFITRSGVISSVHSFTQSGLGPYFLTFLLIVVVGFSGLLLSRLSDLRGPAELESYLSREAAFLFNNLILVGIAFAVFWGTIFPVISEAVRGVKITVGPPFFNKVNGPLALALIFLMGVGPLIAWRRATRKNLMQSFAAPAVVGVLTGLFVFLGGVREWYVLTGFSLAAFVLGTVVVEFERGVLARGRMVHEKPPRALVNLVAKNNRRYGGYIVHVGVAFAFIAIIGSSFFKTEVKRSVREGQSFQVGPYRLVYLGLSSLDTAHLENLSARLSVMRNGKMVAVMEPAKLFYKRPQQPATKVAIRSTLSSDLYVVLAGVDDKSGLVTFDVFLTPLVSWLWLGGLTMALGTVVTIWPNAREREAIAAAARRRMGELEREVAAGVRPT
ncbi:MAG TPA: heme lyase CcmF/NrfE family subunit [Candidatus Binataceae bacterium]|jgi:cytochrome c-type biogenesis protein CcmF|nr:heme lyase CcmF/NrfE family subunit [Candidatus Binataceae bacterium]